MSPLERSRTSTDQAREIAQVLSHRLFPPADDDLRREISGASIRQGAAGGLIVDWRFDLTRRRRLRLSRARWAAAAVAVPQGTEVAGRIDPTLERLRLRGDLDHVGPVEITDLGGWLAVVEADGGPAPWRPSSSGLAWHVAGPLLRELVDWRGPPIWQLRDRPDHVARRIVLGVEHRQADPDREKEGIAGIDHPMAGDRQGLVFTFEIRDDADDRHPTLLDSLDVGAVHLEPAPTAGVVGHVSPPFSATAVGPWLVVTRRGGGGSGPTGCLDEALRMVDGRPGAAQVEPS